MTTEFVNNLLTGDERICNRLGDIISASLRQNVEDQEKSIQVLEQKVAELENKQRIQDAKADEQEQYSRRENVQIWTSEKENEGENTDTIILNLATKMQVQLKVEDISGSQIAWDVPEQGNLELSSVDLQAGGLRDNLWNPDPPWRTERCLSVTTWHGHGPT